MRTGPKDKRVARGGDRIGGGPTSPVRALLVIFVVSVVCSVVIGGLLNSVYPISPREVHLFIRTLGVWGPAAIVAGIALLIVFVPVPTIPVEIAAGIGYGALLGTVYALLGNLIGASIAFFLARRFGRPVLVRVMPERALASIDRMAESLGVRLLILMRLLPLFDFKVVSYAAGLTDMTYRDYLLGTAAGIVLPAFGMVTVGAQLTAHPLRAALVVGAFGLLAGVGAAYLFFGRGEAVGNRQ